MRLHVESLIQHAQADQAPLTALRRSMIRSEIMALTIGTQLGSHEITALLGKGGMGEVYRARDLKLKREVAIKILPEEFSRDADRVRRFRREAEVLASFNYPNIAAIYDLQSADGQMFLVMEYVSGETLDGKEIYFLSLDNKVMAAAVTVSGSAFSAGAPEPLFPITYIDDRWRQYAVSRDGRFLVIQPGETANAPITLIVNWPALLAKK